jgi:hypothetical protein
VASPAEALTEIGIDVSHEFLTDAVVCAPDTVITIAAATPVPPPGNRYEDQEVDDPDAKPFPVAFGSGRGRRVIFRGSSTS